MSCCFTAGDLSLRVGIHSGPVTAGVLRGDRARFQLFGDVMNTTARIEGTGRAGRIQVSQETADLINKAGKSQWLVKRRDAVQAKGKSDLQTYWIQTNDEALGNGLQEEEEEATEHGNTTSHDEVDDLDLAGGDRKERLIDWNVQTLLRLIKQVVQRRELTTSVPTNGGGNRTTTAATDHVPKELAEPETKPLEEVKDIITLPEFHQTVSTSPANSNLDDIQVSIETVRELRLFVTGIANMYRDNSFHNFDHASVSFVRINTCFCIFCAFLLVY